MLPVLIHLWGVLEYIWDIRVLLLFLASFLQELALLHGWIEHALLPPDYMDLSGIYINSSAAARVCTILQTKNAAHNSQRDTDLSKERRRWEDGRHKEGEEGEVCYRVIDSLAQTKRTYQYVHVSPHQLHLMTFVCWKRHMLTHIQIQLWYIDEGCFRFHYKAAG